MVTVFSVNMVTVFMISGYSVQYLQTVHHSPALPSIVFLLPLVHLADELEEGALRHGRVPVRGPAQELELLHHAVPVLRLQSTHWITRSQSHCVTHSKSHCVIHNISHCFAHSKSHCVTHSQSHCVTDSQSQCVTHSQSHCVTDSQSQCVTRSQSHCVTHSQSHCVTHSQSHCVTHSQSHCVIHNISHCFAHSKSHCVTHSQSHCVTDSQSHCVTHSQSHCVTHSQSHCVTHSQSHCVTHSQSHCVTHSQSHCVTHSQSHCVTHSQSHCVTHSQSHCVTHSLTGQQRKGRAGIRLLPAPHCICGISYWWCPPPGQLTQTPPGWGHGGELHFQASTEDTTAKRNIHLNASGNNMAALRHKAQLVNDQHCYKYVWKSLACLQDVCLESLLCCSPFLYWR